MKLFNFLLAVSLFTSPFFVKAQTPEKAIIISPQIGNEIDSIEKAEYHLFPYFSIKTFGHAQIYRQADSTYLVKVTLNNGGVDSKIISKEELNAIQSRTQDIIESNTNTGLDANYSSSLNQTNFFYLFGSIGYASNLLEQEIDYSSSNNSIKTGGYGTGVQLNFGLGFNIAKRTEIELKAEFFNGADVYLYQGRCTPSITKLSPLIKKIFKYKKINPFLKVGPTFVVTSEYMYNLTSFSNGHTVNIEYKTTGGFATGIHAAYGFSTEITKKLHFFGEATVNVLTHSPAEQDLIRYRLDGVDQTKNITNPHSTFSTSPGINNTTQRIKQYNNMSNIGFNIGFMLYLR